MLEVKSGTYKHFKGFLCYVIGVAKQTETEEELVIYTHDGKIWARPKQMFLEEIEKDGYKCPRFKFIEE